MALSFNDITAKNYDSVLIVDFLNLAFRWKHQGRTDFRYDILQTVESFANSFKCGRIIITTDRGGSTYRKNIDPEYKANRTKMKEEQSEKDRIAFEEFLEEYIIAQDIAAEKYPVLGFRGVEADDIAAHLVKNRAKYGFKEIHLLSSDRDWDLLIDEGISRFSYVTRKEVNTDNWSEHYDVTPEQYISYKCLIGDTGDNIPGIPQVGPKRAAGLLETYHSAMDVYDAIPIPGKYKYIANINSSKDRILLNYELMDLITYCDEAVGPENIEDIKEIIKYV